MIAQLKLTVAQQQKDFQATAARQQEQIEALYCGLAKGERTGRSQTSFTANRRQ